MLRKQNLKIAFVIDDGLDRPDGVQQYVIRLGAWLANQGHEVHYIAGQTDRKDIPHIFSLTHNITVRYNGNTLRTPLPASNRRLKAHLEKEQYDIIHVQMPYSPFYAAKVVKLAPASAKIIGTFHILPYGFSQDFATQGLGLYLRKNLRKFDKFLAVSEPARIFAKKAFGVEAEVLPNPVEVAVFKTSEPKAASDCVQVVYLGRLVPRKGCLELLRAVHYMQKNKLATNPFYLNICGKGGQTAQLKEYVAKKNLESIVEFHGYVAEGAKPQILKNADIAVFPSYAGESFGIVLIEAIAAGSGVVLAGNNPGYRSVLGGIPECLVDTRNIGVLASHLAKLIDHPQSRQSIHAKQAKIVQQFDIQVVGSNLENIYRSLAK